MKDIGDILKKSISSWLNKDEILLLFQNSNNLVDLLPNEVCLYPKCIFKYDVFVIMNSWIIIFREKNIFKTISK